MWPSEWDWRCDPAFSAFLKTLGTLFLHSAGSWSCGLGRADGKVREAEKP